MEAKVNFVGVAANMPGTNGGYTMATFRGDEVPEGTKLYLEAPRWRTDTPPVKTRRVEEFLVAIKHYGSGSLLTVTTAFFANDYQVLNDGTSLPKGWYVCTPNRHYVALGYGVVQGWMELPVFNL